MKKYFKITGIAAAVMIITALLPGTGASAQDIFEHHGAAIPEEVDAMYVRGLAYLVKTQNADGDWPSNYGKNTGVVGLCILAMLAHGEDPNYGPYSGAIKRGINMILSKVNENNGYIGSSMYNHGFATLALAEAYGAVDDPRIGPALKQAIDLIISAQSRNSMGAWRYSPTSSDADTTVSGAQMVSLFAARNAGIHVPDSAIKQGLKYYKQCQAADGGFGYTAPSSSSPATTAIGAVVFALARKKDSREFRASSRYVYDMGTHGGRASHPYYMEYYAAQAMFHRDDKSWKKWNKENIKRMKSLQNSDGSWSGGNVGATFATATALLTLAVDYRFLPIYER